MERTYVAKGCIDKINVSCNAKRHNRGLSSGTCTCCVGESREP